jgi:3-hydroxyacyl-CoA dehydrogenase / enoyl-CoA hydratase / 3-hydroxybutyryl-CoA epimerase
MSYKHFNIVDKGEFALVEFDVQGENANVFSTPVMTEFKSVIEALGVSKFKAAAIVSKKKNIFIAGADINEIKNLKTKEEINAATQAGQDIFNMIEDSKIVFVAAIHGACVGGGCEMSIACDWRIASDAKSTKIGLPEVQLGIIPGFGGCVRLPRVIGLIQSLQIILPGATVPALKAYKSGLIDELIPEALFAKRVESFMSDLVKKGAKKRKKTFSPGVAGKLMESPLLKWKIFSESLKTVMKESKGHYPAPLEALSVVKRTYGMSNREKALKIEREGFCAAAQTEVSKNLIQLFFWMENIKKRSGISSTSTAKAKPIKTMGVLGAGTMGGGIAQLAADKGVRVRMKDINNASLMRGFEAAADIWNKAVKRKKLSPQDFQKKMGLLTGTLDFSGFKNIDLVVEAIVEDMNVKKKVIAETVQYTGENTIIATNTSSLSVAVMSEAHPKPENFVGLHYFNPVNKMPLVEVIRGPKTSDETTTTVFEFAKKMGKTPVVVKDGPGFLVNRLLLPLLSEALFILQDGYDIESVDKKYTHVFGNPMGPFRLMDEVGIDVCIKVLKIFKASFGDRMQVSPLTEKFADLKDRLGRKTKKGFYIYDNDGRPTGVDPEVYKVLGLGSPNKNFDTQEIIDRGVLSMVNEAALALYDDKIVESAEELDLAMIFGTGFPPFRGGLLKYADSQGLKKIVERLEAFEIKYGKRFKPTRPLIDLVNNQKNFY